MRGADAAIAIAIVLVVCPAMAGAQPASAETLFQQGRALLVAGDLAGACEKFDASNREEASVGTLLNLGDCRERLGDTETAWATFLAAEALARKSGDDRADEAARRAHALEPAPVPPQASAPAPASEPATPPTTLVVHQRAPSRWTVSRKLAIGAGAIGLAALGGGVAFGMRTSDLEDGSNALCPSDVCADPEGLRLNREARETALRANVCFGVAAASLAGAAVLWLVGAPSAVTPIVARDHVAISLAGRF